ncbi:EutN/CcmL family microcompartment protein [Robertmurraya andreesenii]|uniref:Ethanolamine utilization protein EutN n=1 Tax=Anoxybacillus andreesenii TaxID=1325932 RepID=A0ABT9V7D2_9BACL|nr:EutN/CcmL family microcompartment protein [Robertmurraya andreesenii]MDQ0156862.1 ethanolamine utilization protein EutN [Robertmurraya andreesenii]
MVIGRVIGRVVSTRKYEGMQGVKLLVIEPCFGNKSDYFVAADELGAGEGELVLVSKGETARHALDKFAPIDAIVVGIVDGEPTIEISRAGVSNE